MLGRIGLRILTLCALAVVVNGGLVRTGAVVSNRSEENQSKHLSEVLGDIINWNGVDYMGSKVEVVDFHLHTGTWDDLPRSFQDTLLGNIPFPFNCRLLAEPFVNIILSARGIAAQLLCSRITKGVLFATYAPETTGLTTNRFVRKEIAKKPHRFYGMASLPVDNWEKNEEDALNLLRKYLGFSEFIGVKMAHPHMKINLNDDRFYSIYGVAQEFGKPVFIHTGLAGSDFEGSFTNPEATHPNFVEEAIALFPNVKFILGHMGNKAEFEGLPDPYDACFRLALTYPNVYLETSALGNSDEGSERLLRVFQGAKELGLVDKMIYGSDGPQFPGYPQDYLSLTLSAMKTANYTVDEARRALHENFEVLFGVNI